MFLGLRIAIPILRHLFCNRRFIYDPEKSGTVNNLVYEYTVYGEGQYNYYLPLYNLFVLIDKIIACGECTKCINFNPFFISSKTGYVEFDEYMCYIECSNNEAASANDGFITGCKSEKEPVSEASMYYALCKNTEGFHNALNSYKHYIQEKIPVLAAIIKSDYGLSDEELLLGYFGFEVYSD